MKQTKKGFTLIELLIVIAIIGILAAIAIPQYSRYRRNAQDAAAQSALHNIRLVQEAIFAEKPDAVNYVSDYKVLADAGLVKDPAINYGKITVKDGNYTVAVKHKAVGTSSFTFDSSTGKVVTGNTAVDNDWKDPTPNSGGGTGGGGN